MLDAGSTYFVLGIRRNDEIIRLSPAALASMKHLEPFEVSQAKAAYSQSPKVEGAKPMSYVTTLILFPVGLTLDMNAIILRT